MQKKVEDLSAEYKAWKNDDEIDVLPGTEHRPATAESFETVLNTSVSRRSVLKGSAVAGATMVVAPAALLSTGEAEAHWGRRGDHDKPWWKRTPGDRLQFETVPPGNEPDIVVPENYDVDVILRWGDPLTPDAPSFDVNNQTGAAQAKQFGFNADLVLWYPLPFGLSYGVWRRGGLSKKASRFIGKLYPKIKDRHSWKALVVVNHEYTKGVDMFPGYDGGNPTANEVDVEIEAHGYSVVELVKNRKGQWKFNRKSPFNRRVTGSTPIQISGPLAGHDLLKTSDDPTGTEVLGTLNNCAGGKTPWGTTITCEENFDQYFANFDAVSGLSKDLSLRIAAPGGESGRKWERYVDRFDLSKEPNEYNRFGYCVEVDPYNPGAPAKKRTALGRFKHEGAAVVVAKNRKVVLYSGDDARFEYVYKFVTKGKYNKHNRLANMDLLDEGTLYVARFDAGDATGDDLGSGEWLELSTENPALTGWTMEEILLNTRGAADVVGATPMDRPEDVEASPVTGKVYVCMTNNSRRDGEVGSGATRIVNGREVSSEPNESNPRNSTADGSINGNQHGHVIEIIEDNEDATSTTFAWNILVKCGDPNEADHFTSFGDIADPVAAGVSPISDPDNIVHDDDGNLWIATDGQYFSGGVGFGQNDGIFAVPVEGPDRGLLRQFLSGVPGGEVCGPEFSGDNHTFFCAIQHPNDGNAFNEIWPIGDPDMVSKPSLVAVREKSGKKIGF